MPSVSKKQHNFMAAVANNPKFAKKVGVKSSIGEEFMKADKKRKFREGGLKEVDSDSNPGLSKLPTEVRNKMGYMKKGGDVKESKMMVKKEVEFMKKKGAPKSMIKHEMAEAKGMKKGGYAKGGMSECKTVAKKEVKAHEKRMHKMAGGGKVGQLSKADGVAKQGKSKGTMVKMKKGGYC
jgi:hypothetical protein